MAHHRPIRLTAHDDADNRHFRTHDSSEFTNFVGNSLEKTKAFTITKPDKGDVKGLARVREDTFFTHLAKVGQNFCLRDLLVVLK